jgi:hypothetical protein
MTNVTPVTPSPSAVADFAHRLLLANRGFKDEPFDRLREEVRAQPDGGLELLMALADNTSERVRDWAAYAARKELGHAGLPVLLKLAKHPRTFTRDGAMQKLAEIDIELLRPFIPDMRRIFRRSDSLYSEGGAAMWRLVRLRDVGSAPILRAFAEKRNFEHYDGRMPAVLADYREDTASIERRIAAHDHDWMLWLVRAARQLGLPNAETALAAGSRDLPDETCRELCAKELAALRSPRARAAESHDIRER